MPRNGLPQETAQLPVSEVPRDSTPQGTTREPLTEAPRDSAPQRNTRSQALWLCLYLPNLPLEAADVAEEAEVYAVFDEQQGVRQVLQASAAAHAAGIHAGLSVNAALALQPDLLLAERDVQHEEEVLQSLAVWAERFTSFVTLEPPAVLLLEIAASLRLFAGLKELRQQIVTELAEQGFSALPAIAPTPLAATWLARAGTRRCIVGSEHLNSTLSALPLHCLAWPDKVIAALQGMGIDCVGELLRLPRDGFAKRFGVKRLLALDRALGRLPDPREHFRSPVAFCADADLDGEHDNSEWLLDVCAQLLVKLERFLLARQLAAQRLSFSFYHLQHPATPLTLACLQAGNNAARWLALLRIRFERVELPAPVIAIRLHAADGQPLTATTAALGFSEQGSSDTSIAPLVERLAARIGAQAIHGVGTVAEHRPDRAWQRQRAFEINPQCAAMPDVTPNPRMPELLADMQRTRRLLLRRPLWLLEQPEPLKSREGRPYYQGPLAFQNGPERIETGWWDDKGVARDYYVAKSQHGAYLWIFCERASGNWYLHGRFG
ncbi:MAG: DNA polymerase Y family protein [Woeseia sp.]